MIQLQVENTSTCNARCTFCPYPHMARHGGRISDDLYIKVMADAATIDLITHITITGLGEPTLDARLADQVRIARAAKPKAFIDVFTNGVYAKPALIDALWEAGLDCLVFSLNATTPEQHEATMGLKDKFETVCSHIDYAISTRGRNRVEVRAVPTDWTKEQVAAFYSRWGHRQIKGYGQLISQGNWTGNVPAGRKFDPNEACLRALSQIYVTHDGKVTSCCFDPAGVQVFGDLNRQTLREVYSSPEYVAFREAHNEGRAASYSVCATCTRI